VFARDRETAAIQRFLADKPEVKVFYDVVDSYRVIEGVKTLAADFGLPFLLCASSAVIAPKRWLRPRSA